MRGDAETQRGLVRCDLSVEAVEGPLMNLYPAALDWWGPHQSAEVLSSSDVHTGLHLQLLSCYACNSLPLRCCHSESHAFGDMEAQAKCPILGLNLVTM